MPQKLLTVLNLFPTPPIKTLLLTVPTRVTHLNYDSTGHCSQSHLTYPICSFPCSFESRFSIRNTHPLSLCHSVPLRLSLVGVSNITKKNKFRFSLLTSVDHGVEFWKRVVWVRPLSEYLNSILDTSTTTPTFSLLQCLGYKVCDSTTLTTSSRSDLNLILR